ncbi:STE3-domain-containing protein [Lepidopterella palustris CBS 459.81]|uniref:STE3-domain-containing protein n=1 Tax=Lepidopterella palustris CBS 459.81 TaxID=1314670 RepID=A0A8E2EHQ0_9PEZI|nr:STE3-domain-containing protein [Lepidopterella palustris CBS 459.81]
MNTASYPLYPVAILLPVLAAIVVILDIPPMIWHFKQRNIAATSLVFWIIIRNIPSIINPIIWPRDNLADWWMGQGLCDVQVRLFVGGTIALPGALACIMRQLARVMDTKNIVLASSRKDRVRETVLEILWCFGFPLLITLVYYIVQPIRYFLWGISGCNPAFDSSWPSVALVTMWPPIISLVDAVYAGLVIYRLYRYRTQFGTCISAHNFTKSRFVRVFLMSLSLIIIVIPFQFYILARNAQYISGAYSWSRVHGPTWDEVVTIPSFGVVIFDRWFRIAHGFLVFFAFGTGRDAMRLYKGWLMTLGLGNRFPSLHQTSSWTSGSSWKGRLDSFSNKAKSMFSRNDIQTTASTSTSTETIRSASLLPASTTDPILPSTATTTKLRPSRVWSLFTSSKSRRTLLPLFSTEKSSIQCGSQSASSLKSKPHLHSIVTDNSPTVYTKVWSTDPSSRIQEHKKPDGVRVKHEFMQDNRVAYEEENV